MSRRPRLFTPVRVYWLTAVLGLPLFNPLLLVVGLASVPVVVIVVAANAWLLWRLGKRAWPERRAARNRAYFLGALVVAVCTYALFYAELLALLLILSLGCPPDAYECPV